MVAGLGVPIFRVFTVSLIDPATGSLASALAENQDKIERDYCEVVCYAQLPTLQVMG